VDSAPFLLFARVILAPICGRAYSWPATLSCHHTRKIKITDNRSPLFEIARVLVRFDHVASFIVKVNHGIMRTAEKLGLADCFAHCIRLAIRADAHRCGVKV
jgi:hypothetical protein